MADTTQKANRSTGRRKAPTGLVGRATGRRNKQDEERYLNHLTMTGFDYLRYMGNSEYTFRFKDDPCTTLSEFELKLLRDPFVLKFCRFNQGYKVTVRTAVWWGLLEKDEDKRNSIPENNTIRWVKFDPNLGIEGEQVKGKFFGKESEGSRPFPICMYSLSGLENSLHIPKERRELFETCTLHNPGEWVEVGPLRQDQTALPYRSTSAGGCIPIAAADAVHPYDPEAARRMAECHPDIASLTEFSKYLEDEDWMWRTEDPFQKLDRGSSKTTMEAQERLQWLLEHEEGIFLVIPLTGHGENSHAIGLDFARRTIYDPLEQKSLRLSEEGIKLCAGGSVNQCAGIGEARLLYCDTVARGRKRRRKTAQRERKRSNRGGARSSEPSC